MSTKIRTCVLAVALVITTLVPGVPQGSASIMYYRGAEGFKLKELPAAADYSIILTGDNPVFKQLMIETSKSGTDKKQKDVMDIDEGPFSIRYIFRDGPGTYNIILFGSKSKKDRHFAGICAFTIESTSAIPDNVKKEEEARASEALVREARAAFDYLNRVRANPQAFSGEIGISLAGIQPLPPLKWDERLARSARLRAEDMARRNYFGHVNPDGIGPNYYARQEGYRLPDFWPSARNANNIESISAGPESGSEHVVNLLYDQGAGNASAGHRIHLLGLNSFFSSHAYIGVGMAKNPKSTYGCYLVIHTAP